MYLYRVGSVKSENVKVKQWQKNEKGRQRMSKRASESVGKNFFIQAWFICMHVFVCRHNLFALISIADDALQLFFRSFCKLFSN